MSITGTRETHLIWGDIDVDFDAWKSEFANEYPDATEDQMYRMMVDQNNDMLDDERANLIIHCGTEIIAFADIGRWNGRVSGYKTIESGLISDCLNTECDHAEWYVDDEGEFRFLGIHHDGRNYVYYRKLKAGTTEEERDDLLCKVYDGTATQEDIDKITEKLGPMIGQVYGWFFE